MDLPSRALAERILLRLVEEKLLTEANAKKLLPKLATGGLKVEDWRLALELSDAKESEQ